MKEPRIEIRGSWLSKTVQSIFNELTAAHAVSAVQTFIAGSATYRDMSAGITGRRITLHTLGGCIHRIHTRHPVSSFLTAVSWKWIRQ